MVSPAPCLRSSEADPVISPFTEVPSIIPSTVSAVFRVAELNPIPVTMRSTHQHDQQQQGGEGKIIINYNNACEMYCYYMLL